MDDIFEPEQNDEPTFMEVTLADAIAQMKKAWTNERIARKLLPHRFDLVDSLLGEVERTQAELEETTDKTRVTYGAKRTDVDRVSYVINSYIRTRMRKIEANAAALLMEHTERQAQQKDDLMDEREVVFAENYHKDRVLLFNSTLFNELSENLRPLPIAKLPSGGRCFVRVAKERDLRGVAVFDMNDPNSDVLVDLQAGSTHLIPFNSIQSHLEADNVELL
ncbi:DNA replication complex GINS protein SLD5 [Aphelenchoides fujianensis]|nr:DNA replication complex GINS protein SLD5 [Aphelenchoides fujianensis]